MKKNGTIIPFSFNNTTSIFFKVHLVIFFGVLYFIATLKFIVSKNSKQPNSIFYECNIFIRAPKKNQ